MISRAIAAPSAVPVAPRAFEPVRGDCGQHGLHVLGQHGTLAGESAQAWAARTRPCAARGERPSCSSARERATSACT